ncbi:hypothetical protein [Achromobacter phage Motura]|uniref:Uncharacterized protein n=1 Tax=Achromobacter phage Motura TaxID=2591403 RepID=A0A514CSU0_9CAUD|nr:hypothetical protein H1O15_gp239 [Achromobacter phage Motura]QDH83549.1 hypothetical protein [Achromobacter phage Motura]
MQNNIEQRLNTDLADMTAAEAVEKLKEETGLNIIHADQANPVVIGAGTLGVDEYMLGTDRDNMVRSLMALGAGPGIVSMLKDEDFQAKVRDPETEESKRALSAAEAKRQRKAEKLKRQFSK